jgi:hypothetical protein
MFWPMFLLSYAEELGLKGLHRESDAIAISATLALLGIVANRGECARRSFDKEAAKTNDAR